MSKVVSCSFADSWVSMHVNWFVEIRKNDYRKSKERSMLSPQKNLGYLEIKFFLHSKLLQVGPIKFNISKMYV